MTGVLEALRSELEVLVARRASFVRSGCCCFCCYCGFCSEQARTRAPEQLVQSFRIVDFGGARHEKERQEARKI